MGRIKISQKHCYGNVQMDYSEWDKLIYNPQYDWLENIIEWKEKQMFPGNQFTNYGNS